MKPPHTVFVVDDEAAVRKALRLMMSTAGYKVEDFASATEFLDAYDPATIGCLILDVRMPGMDGLALLRHLTNEKVLLPVIMLSAHGDIPMAVGAVKTGAVDFCEKPAQAGILREKVAAALELAKQWHYDRSERQEILEGYSKLTAREREIAELLADGKSTEMIAKLLGTSQNTVRVQRHNIRNKMRAATQAELVKMMNTIRADLSE